MNPTLTPSQFTSPDIRPVRHLAPRPPAPDPPGAPAWPTWGQRVLPTPLRGLLVDLGMWHDPNPHPPSQHLSQVLATLHHYGWCKSLDYSPTGRMCIRGAQNLLEKTGHVTPAGRARAADHMQTILAKDGVTMPFWAWNDLPDQQFPAVQQLLTQAADLARQNGE
ncbi:DUF6197 family protein [Streptomyces sp. NBC_01422]|uniref:DUF6197 family protein n=1 Tax=Streptomyces sp. NBC_01422 TaxID=2903859 RepID=UPI002E2B1FDB|nr:hypothetical protein [Streptomyces sp. NBC_01422]